jgi:hypothetical protein
VTGLPAAAKWIREGISGKIGSKQKVAGSKPKAKKTASKAATKPKVRKEAVKASAKKSTAKSKKK